MKTKLIPLSRNSMLAAVLCVTFGAGQFEAQGALSFIGFEYDRPEGAWSADLNPINLQMTTTSGGVGEVIFTISNQSCGDWVDSSTPTITTVSFDDRGGILAGPTIINSAGTEFVADNNVNLPGGNNLLPSFVVDFGFKAVSPPVVKGIDPGEVWSVSFSGTTLAAVDGALASGDLRVGLHVQQITDNDYSASYVNLPPISEIPEPTSSALIGMVGVGWLLVRRRG